MKYKFNKFFMKVNFQKGLKSYVSGDLFSIGGHFIVNMKWLKQFNPESAKKLLKAHEAETVKFVTSRIKGEPYRDPNLSMILGSLPKTSSSGYFPVTKNLLKAELDIDSKGWVFIKYCYIEAASENIYLDPGYFPLLFCDPDFLIHAKDSQSPVTVTGHGGFGIVLALMPIRKGSQND